MGLDAVIEGLAERSQILPFWNPSFVHAGINFQHSLWRVGGSPCAGVLPPTVGSGGAVPTKATAGAIPFDAPAAGGKLKLSHMYFYAGQTDELFVYDRLWHCSGLVANSTAVQNVNSPAHARGDVTGEDVEAFLEIYTAPGATAANVQMVWTDSLSVQRTRAAAAAAIQSKPAGYLVPMATQATGISPGGVKSVDSIQLSASTGTAGDLGITLARRIHTISSVSNFGGGEIHDFIETGLGSVDDNACLWLPFMSQTASPGGPLGGHIELIEYV